MSARDDLRNTPALGVSRLDAPTLDVEEPTDVTTRPSTGPRSVVNATAVDTAQGRTRGADHLGFAEEPRRVADLIVDTLLELGIDTFIGIPGGAIGPIYDALVERRGVRVINARHETGAVFAAMGYARGSGRPPCVLLTSGPGVTNALTGLAAADSDGIPLIVLAGEVPRQKFGRGALQEGSRYELDLLGMVRSVSKYSAELTTPHAAPLMVRKAFATAMSGRQGPVFLSLPLDVAAMRVVPARVSTRVSTGFELNAAMLASAAIELQRAERPLIFAGSGARHPAAVAALRELAESLQIPVMTTPKAKGLFPESNPLSLGVYGYGGHPSARAYLEQRPDVLLCVGCGLSETSTNNWSRKLQPQRTLIQIDIDAAQIGRNYEVHIGLVGDSGVLLRGILDRSAPRTERRWPGGISHDDPDSVYDDSIPLRPARVLRKLQELFPADTIFTSDIGEHLLFALHYLRIDRADGFIANLGLGSMGSGIGASVGAKLAFPRRPVVSICGDFGFQMQGMELATCVQDRIGVVFAIFNDARMRMVESGNLRVFGRTVAMHSQRVDFAMLARSVGAQGFTIQSVDDLDALPVSRLLGDVPTVLDIAIDPKSAFGNHGRVEEFSNFVSTWPKPLDDRS